MYESSIVAKGGEGSGGIGSTVRGVWRRNGGVMVG